MEFGRIATIVIHSGQEGNVKHPGPSTAGHEPPVQDISIQEMPVQAPTVTDSTQEVSTPGGQEAEYSEIDEVGIDNPVTDHSYENVRENKYSHLNR